MLLTEPVNGKVNYGTESTRKPTTTLGGKPVLTKYFQHQSSMATREVYLVKASHFPSYSIQFRYSSMEKEQVTCWWFLLGDSLIWGLGARGPTCSHTSRSSLLPTNISHQTRQNTQHFGSPKHFTTDLHKSMMQLRLFTKLYSMPGVWQSDSIWTVSKT